MSNQPKQPPWGEIIRSSLAAFLLGCVLVAVLALGFQGSHNERQEACEQSPEICQVIHPTK